MMWDRVIEFPEEGMRLRDVLDILMSCLDTVEIEIFAEHLVGGLKGNLLESCDYEMDV